MPCEHAGGHSTGVMPRRWPAGVIMLMLAGLGFWHRRRTPAEAELNR